MAAEDSNRLLSNGENEKELSEVNGIEAKVMGTEKDELFAKIEEDSGTGLKRQVNLLGGICLLVGTIIGSGIFASPTTIAERVQSPGATLLVWTGCGLIAMFGALCYVELGTMYPNESGGEYIYIQKAFGDLPAFLLAFTSVSIIKPSSMALIALTCGDYLMVAISNLNPHQILQN
uniref:Uncharacterized protein n=1 Tax=Clytia hemisphaerica TaxID=252671 RepID=A0A7M5WTC4_9CNID|eukprot:TCONS_00009294-protein